MAARLEEIKSWFESAVNNGSTHLIVVCDTFDYEDYPIWCSSEEQAREQFEEHDEKNMQRIMEVYRIDLGWEAQSRGRVMNW